MKNLSYTFSAKQKQKKQFTDDYIISELEKIGLINTTDFILYKKVNYIINNNIYDLKFEDENEFHQIVKKHINEQGETGIIIL